jgi:hypothetical protein
MTVLFLKVFQLSQARKEKKPTRLGHPLSSYTIYLVKVYSYPSQINRSIHRSISSLLGNGLGVKWRKEAPH